MLFRSERLGQTILQELPFEATQNDGGGEAGQLALWGIAAAGTLLAQVNFNGYLTIVRRAAIRLGAPDLQALHEEWDQRLSLLERRLFAHIHMSHGRSGFPRFSAIRGRLCLEKWGHERLAMGIPPNWIPLSAQMRIVEEGLLASARREALKGDGPEPAMIRQAVRPDLFAKGGFDHWKTLFGHLHAACM